MLAMGNILFLIGLTIIIGPQKTLAFFARKQKLKGTAAFFLGLFLILMRWALVGFMVELYGIFILFGDFLGTILGFGRNVPVVGPWIGVLIDRLGLGGGQGLPVWKGRKVWEVVIREDFKREGEMDVWWFVGYGVLMYSLWVDCTIWRGQRRWGLCSCSAQQVELMLLAVFDDHICLRIHTQWRSCWWSDVLF